MVDEHGRWIVREIADVVATATEFGRRRDNGEVIPHDEHRSLQRRKVDLLRAISARTPGNTNIRGVLRDAELQLRILSTQPCADRPTSSAPANRGLLR